MNIINVSNGSKKDRIIFFLLQKLFNSSWVKHFQEPEHSVHTDCIFPSFVSLSNLLTLFFCLFSPFPPPFLLSISLFPLISCPLFLLFVAICHCMYVHACLRVCVCMCVCAWWGLWSVSAGHQSVCAERAGGVGDGTEAHWQQSRCGGATTAKPHGNRWVTHTRQ